MSYWSATDIVRQVAGELGLEIPGSLMDSTDKQAFQLLSLLNAAGNELVTYYPWEQFVKQWNWNTVEGQDAYDLPSDWGYFVDQTQWDRTNHWPLLGPKSPQEWSWLKGGLLQAAPRMRYRIYGDQFYLHPVPGSSSFNIVMEYITKNWMTDSTGATPSDMITANGDIVQFYPWLMVKFLKLKFYQLKGFDTTAVTDDFMRVYNAMTGKSKGAPKLSLAPRVTPILIGPWNVPDGSWDVTP